MKNSKKTSIVTGSLIAGAIVSLSSINAGASNLFNYNSLGSGAELRSELLNVNVSPLKVSELECGDKKKTDSKAKTGEQKCGDKKKAADSKSKTSEGKCGEGKCGDKKTTTK